MFLSAFVKGYNLFIIGKKLMISLRFYYLSVMQKSTIITSYFKGWCNFPDIYYFTLFDNNQHKNDMQVVTKELVW